MCGFCGRINIDRSEPVLRETVCKMRETLLHRGPDDAGLLVEANVGLGHRRLSIIDLSEAGRQPMCNEDGTIWIVYNGEVYNFKELKKELKKKGHQFRSLTDTEVIIHLYEEDGIHCLHKLRGMFAFAIWDKKRERFFLARDRLGQKPLFYYLDQKKLLFASEIKAILQGDVCRELDYEAIHHYLTFRYIPHPHTVFKYIKKLPPAHFLTFERNSVHLQKYWELQFIDHSSHNDLTKMPVKKRYDEDGICEEIVNRLKEAVKIRLISNVPLGALLSGGIDSSAIVALMSEMTTTPVQTFSVDFEEKGYSEIDYARIVAKRFETDHHEIVIRPEATTILPEIVKHYDEPFADPSAIPTFYISRFASEFVKVALNGDGGDENFAGYGNYIQNKISQYFHIVPRFVCKKIIGKFLKVAQEYLEHEEGKINSLRQVVEVAHHDMAKRYACSSIFIDAFLKERIYTDEFKEIVGHRDSLEILSKTFESKDIKDLVNRLLASDIETFLPDDLLVKIDMASMANSVEGRSPFLDHKFMEFIAKIPGKLKLRGMEKKYILKKSLQNILPNQILKRPKRGFDVPIAKWLRHDLKDMTSDILLSDSVRNRGYFKIDVIAKMFDDHCNNRANWANELWELLILEIWHREVLD